MDKLVSAIITTHNRKELLLKAITSVLNQTYTQLQCIVVDDASTDGTREALQSLIQEGKITYFYIEPQDSRGGNYARNIGIANAVGEYIAFLDDDDEWLPDKIEKQMQLFINHPEIGMAYCGLKRQYIKNDCVYKQLESSGIGKKDTDLSKEVLIHIITVTSSIMVKKSLLDIIGTFDENLKYWQEYEFCIRLLQNTKAGYLEGAYVLYRVFEGDKKRLSNNIEGWEESVRYILKKHTELYDKLSIEEEALRKVYYYIDGINRAKKVRSIKYFMKYLAEIVRDTKALKIFIEKALYRFKNK